MKHPFDLTGQVAVVTGSSKGIGRSIAEIMARMGAKVVVSSRKAEACEEVAAGIRKAGGDATVIPCHIGRREDCEGLVKGAIAKYGRIDTMVCNAAVNPYFGPLSGISDDQWDKIMESNIRSNLWLANLAAPGMVERGGGTIDRSAAAKILFDLSFAKRPAEEFYDLRADPWQMHNVAGDARFAVSQKKLRADLDQYLTATKDPRASGQGAAFDTYHYVTGAGGKARKKP